MEMAPLDRGASLSRSHVVETIRSQPVSLKIRGTTESTCCASLRDVITDTVYRRQKHPFMSLRRH